MDKDEILVNIDENFYDILEELAFEENISLSIFIRKNLKEIIFSKYKIKI